MAIVGESGSGKSTLMASLSPLSLIRMNEFVVLVTYQILTWMTNKLQASEHEREVELRAKMNSDGVKMLKKFLKGQSCFSGTKGC